MIKLQDYSFGVKRPSLTHSLLTYIYIYHSSGGYGYKTVLNVQFYCSKLGFEYF
jgi:hypothetical protein